MDPLVCATLTAPTPGEMVKASRHADADLVEVRLDALDHLDAGVVRRLAEALERPAIGVLRSSSSGGRFDGSPDRRGELLQAAVRAGFELVETDLGDPAAEGVLDEADRAGGRVLMARAHHDGVPPEEELVADALEARDLGAWGLRVLAPLGSPRDAARLVAAAQRALREGARLAVGSPDDPILHLAAPGIGSALAYAEPSRDAPDEDLTPGMLRAVHGTYPPLDIRASTRWSLLLAHPVGDALGPPMITAAYRAEERDAVHLAVDVDPRHLGRAVGALQAMDALGANVGDPHRERVLDHVDGATPTVRSTGSANTLVCRGDDVIAHDTDGAGALRALHEAGVTVDRARVVVLGTGSTARSIVHALGARAAHVQVAASDATAAGSLADLAGGTAVSLASADDALAEADVLVRCTGGGPQGSPEAPLDALTADHAVLDAMVEPGGSRLVRAARAVGATAVGGDELLLHQGAEALRLWTGEDPPVPVMRRVLEDRLVVHGWRLHR